MWARSFLCLSLAACVGGSAAEAVDGDDVDGSGDPTPVAPGGSAGDPAATPDAGSGGGGGSGAACTPYAAQGHAYGLSIGALGQTLIQAPDTTTPNGGVKLLDLPLPTGLSLSLKDTLFSISDTHTATDNGATDVAIASTNSLDLGLPLLGIHLGAVVAKATTTITPTGATSTSVGSQVVDLRINGVSYGNILAPQSFIIPFPLLNTPFVELRLLETIPSAPNAARAKTQVNALHLVVLDGTLDVIVGHAESEAAQINCNPT